MRLSYQELAENEFSPTDRSRTEGAADSDASVTQAVSDADPTRPDLSYLGLNFGDALKSFYSTLQRILEDNPVDAARLGELAEKAQRKSITSGELKELHTLKTAATRQGRAVGGVYGFFLKYRPYPMLAEIRSKEEFFQPLFGPVMVVGGDCIRDVLTRHDTFTVAPYGREMVKTMTPAENGGFDTFILSTDDPGKFSEDKRLLTTVVNHADTARLTELVHHDCQRRLNDAVRVCRAAGYGQIDLVTAIARFVPVTMCHHYLGIPVADETGSFKLSPEMLNYYGDKVAGPDGQSPLPTNYRRPDGNIVELPDSALAEADGVIPDDERMYHWIKAAFQNFFNNVQKDVEIQAHGVRACRELLVYLLRELELRRADFAARRTVADTMLSRLLKLQIGIADPALTPDPSIDPERVGDLRIAENLMGTVVGAVAGQEEASCRMVDAMLRLKEGEFEDRSVGCLSDGQRRGSFEEARQLALNVLEGRDVAASRAQLRQYALEALRLQPQSEILLRECRKDGATIAGGRPIREGTLIFASHGSAMKDTENAEAFIIGRDDKHYLQFGYGRHRCLGQYVAPVILVETLIAVLALENLRRPEPKPDDSAFPLERRFGRFQLDDNNLYARTFTLEFEFGGTTDAYYS